MAIAFRIEQKLLRHLGPAPGVGCRPGCRRRFVVRGVRVVGRRCPRLSSGCFLSYLSGAVFWAAAAGFGRLLLAAARPGAAAPGGSSRVARGSGRAALAGRAARITQPAPPPAEVAASTRSRPHRRMAPAPPATALLELGAVAFQRRRARGSSPDRRFCSRDHHIGSHCGPGSSWVARASVLLPAAAEGFAGAARVEGGAVGDAAVVRAVRSGGDFASNWLAERTMAKRSSR